MDRRVFLTGSGAVAALAAVSPASSMAAKAARGGGASSTNETIAVDGSDGSPLSEASLDRFKAGGADVWYYNGPQTLLEIAQFYEFIDKFSGRVTVAKSVKDIYAAKQAGKLAIVIGWQKPYLLDESAGNEWQWSPAGSPKWSLRAYYELGLRVVSLAYNLTSQFAGGCLDPEVPLSHSGEVLVRKAQEMGILIDCGGHTGERSSLDIIKMSQRPVICSHSNLKALNDNPRNTSDRVIEGIAKTGGVFGVSAVDAFMSWGYKDVRGGVVAPMPPAVTVNRLVDEIDHLMRLVGPDHIGLGPDFSDVTVQVTGKSFAFPPEMSYPISGPLRYVEGFENISKLGAVRAALTTRGYTSTDINKIIGGNWMRVYEQAWRS